MLRIEITHQPYFTAHTSTYLHYSFIVGLPGGHLAQNLGLTGAAQILGSIEATTNGNTHLTLSHMQMIPCDFFSDLPDHR